jgi:hypothetical protein
VDSEGPGDVVRGRDHATAAWIAPDYERQRSQLRVLELLDRGEEGIEIEVRDDHAPNVTRRAYPV